MDCTNTISSASLVQVSDQKLRYTALLNEYTVIGNLSRHMAYMRVTMLVQNLDTSHRQRVSLDLFDSPTLCRIAGEVAAAFGQHVPDVEAEFLTLSDLLENYRDGHVPAWKRKLRLIYPIQTASYREHLEGFRALISAQGYQNALYLVRPCESFLHFLEQQGITAIASVLPQHVLQYREHLTEQANSRLAGGLGESHIREHLFVLRLFFTHLMDAHLLAHSPVVVLRQKNEPKPEPAILSQEEIKALYEACRTQFDKAVLGLCYGCGLRRSEAIALAVNDIDFEQGILTVRSGKFNKTRSVPVADSVLHDLDAYIKGERAACLFKKDSTVPNLLVNNKGRAFGKDRLIERFKTLVGHCTHPRIHFKEVSLQALRRSISTHLLDQGAEFEFVQDFLGHVLLDTTHLYSRKRKLKERFLTEAFDYGHYPKQYPNHIRHE